jgi:hypothetical protein
LKEECEPDERERAEGEQAEDAPDERRRVLKSQQRDAAEKGQHDK